MNNFEIQIIDRLARFEEKLSHTLSLLIEHSERTDDHDKRIRNLETGRAKLIGVVATITFIATSIPTAAAIWS